MTGEPNAVARVAVASPVRRCFDYLIGERPQPAIGARVKVPFRNGTRTGVVLACAPASSLPDTRLKHIMEVIDSCELIPPDILKLLAWASEYYQHPIGDVVVNTLPTLLRKGRAAELPALRQWQLTEVGFAQDPKLLTKRAPQQARLLTLLNEASAPLAAEALRLPSSRWRKALQTLTDKGWVEEIQLQAITPQLLSGAPKPTLSPEQARAVEAVDTRLDAFGAFVLDGVTGSGKTEVYLQLIERTIERGRQAIVLVPEIGLTPQTVARFEDRLGVPVGVLHSGLSDTERLHAWLHARQGTAPVVIGTRSAVFAPLQNPGLFIVDEEHDMSYKQQDGFRYSARDLMVYRAREAGVPVLLGSATPSLESLNNIALDRYTRLVLPNRAAGASHPTVSVVDVRSKPFDCGLSRSVLDAISDNLERGDQSLLFLNRRGFAPALLCHACGWTADCARCDAHMVYHQAARRVRCHHCGVDRRAPLVCAECGAEDMRLIGVGTERVAEGLAHHFPDARLVRLDRDTTQRKGELQRLLSCIRSGDADIIIGTQMLAKGHHFPRVTLVAVLDADGGLFGADFRASERMAQLLVQVAGRAGRSHNPGRVLIQTHHPDHPLLQALLQKGYGHFASVALREREQALLPPSACVALVRAESAARSLGLEFLEQARNHADVSEAGPLLLGPVPAPMERRAGRYRAQLLVQAPRRAVLHRFLSGWVAKLETLPIGRKVRWSIDVDPQDMI